MGITLLTGIAAFVGLYLLMAGMINTVKDWASTSPGKVIRKNVEKVYPNKETTGYALVSTIFWLFDVFLTLGIPIGAGYVLDPYSGPFLGAMIGIAITYWRIKARIKFEHELYTKRKNEK